MREKESPPLQFYQEVSLWRLYTGVVVGLMSTKR